MSGKDWLCPVCGYPNSPDLVVCVKTAEHDADAQDARDAAMRRSLAARIAVNTSWARTPNRAERTAPARAATPVQFEYWLAKARAEHPDLKPAEQRAMAQSAWKAQQQRNALKAAKARQAKRAQTRRASAA